MKNNANELRKKLYKVEVLERIYESVENDMHWDCFDRSDEMNELGEYTWTEPADFNEITWENHPSKSERAEIYKTVLQAIEKIAEKI